MLGRLVVLLDPARPHALGRPVATGEDRGRAHRGNDSSPLLGPAHPPARVRSCGDGRSACRRRRDVGPPRRPLRPPDPLGAARGAARRRARRGHRERPRARPRHRHRPDARPPARAPRPAAQRRGDRPLARDARARVRPLPAGWSALRADARALPLDADAVDLVLAAYLLQILPAADRARVLLEVRRVLAPGGRVVTITPHVPRRGTSRPAAALMDGLARAAPVRLGGLHTHDPRRSCRRRASSCGTPAGCAAAIRRSSSSHACPEPRGTIRSKPATTGPPNRTGRSWHLCSGIAANLPRPASGSRAS